MRAKRQFSFKKAALGLLLLAPLPAGAAEWHVEGGASTIEFDYIAAGSQWTGAFPAFSGEGRFDPANPAASALALEIDIAAIDLGWAPASALARGDAWFDVADHPKGSFRLDKVERLGPDIWRAEGALTLRGVTRPMEARLKLTFGPDGARATGSTRIDRRDFGIGAGVSGALAPVGDTVQVRFDLLARSAD